MLRLYLTILCVIFIKQNFAKQHGKVRIFRGKDAKPNEYRHHVAIFHSGVFKCSGTIIGTREILTAGECVVLDDCQTIGKKLLTVSGGGIELDSLPMKLAVEKVVLHPKYVCKSTLVKNDLALLLVTEEIPLDALAIIGIQSKPVSIHTQCVVVGWGNCDGKQTRKLNTGVALTKNLEICVSDQLVDNIICSENVFHQTPCTGDIGGPLICNNRVTGIVSFGLKDYKIEKYHIYTNVSFYADWIKADHSDTKHLDGDNDYSAESENVNDIDSNDEPNQAREGDSNPLDGDLTRSSRASWIFFDYRIITFCILLIIKMSCL